MQKRVSALPMRTLWGVAALLMAAAGALLIFPHAAHAQDGAAGARPPIVWPPPPNRFAGTAVESSGGEPASAGGMDYEASPRVAPAVATAADPAGYPSRPDIESPIPAASNYGAWTRMAFVQGSDNESELYVADGDGSNMTAVTNNRKAEFDPALSPEGTRIAFVADYNGDGKVSIYLISIYGTDMTPLIDGANGGGDNYDPAWSSDGRYLAFASNRTGVSKIWVYDFATGEQTQVSFDAGPEFDPAFQPGAYNLHWVRALDASAGVIVRRELDGGDESIVTNPLLYLGGTSVAPSGNVAYHYIPDDSPDGWFSVGYSTPDDPATHRVAWGWNLRDYFVDGWAPVAQLPGAATLLINAHDYDYVGGEFLVKSTQILFWDAEESRFPFATVLFGGAYFVSSSTQGFDTTPPQAWTLPAPRTIAQPMPEDLAQIAWTGSDSQSNIAGYRFLNQGFDPEWTTATTIVVDGYLSNSFHICGDNRYSVQALDWAGNWSPVSPARAVTLGYHIEVKVLDARNVPISGAVENAYPMPSTPASDGSGLFVTNFCSIAPGDAFSFAKTGYQHDYRDFWHVRGRSSAIMYAQVDPFYPLVDYPWRESGAWTSLVCYSAQDCPIPGMTLGRAPDAATSQRSKSSLATTVSMTSATPLHEATLNFMLAIKGASGTANHFVVAAQAEGDAEPTILWQRAASNFSPTNVWIDMDDWQGKVFTLTYELTTEIGEPLSLVIIDRPTISAWMTPRPLALTIGSAAATATNSGTIDAGAIDPGTLAATSLLTITGENFVAPVRVAVGPTTATVLSSTATTIVAQVPADVPPGLHDVVVVSNGGYSAALFRAFFAGAQRWLPVVRFD